MTDKEKLLNDYLKNSEKALNILKDKGFSFLNTDLIWQILIYQFGHWDIPTKVLFHNFSIQNIVFQITNYLEENGIIIDNVTLDNSIIPKELYDEIEKAQVKFKGEVWFIHKNDKDLFPSQPHAHNYDRQYKLHLGNGKLYRKKICVGSINRKDFADLRQKIADKINQIKLPIYENN